MSQAFLAAEFQLHQGQFELDVELELPASGVTALFGPSGCGKTTLLRCIAGLQKARHGRLSVGDQQWQNDGYFMPPHRRSIGYVFQEASLLPHLSVEQNLRFGERRAIPGDPKVVDFAEAVELLGLEPLLHRQPEKLSGGERQRVAIGRALLCQPRVLLMDEPLSALDRAGKRGILPFLDRLGRSLNLPTLYVSHSLNEVNRLANRMIYLEAGRVKAQGNISEVVAHLPLDPTVAAESGIVEARVIAHDPGHQLTYLDLAGTRLSISLRDAAIGETVRVRILARDLALSLERPSASSMLNAIPVEITDFAQPAEAGRVLVKLRCGQFQLVSKITEKSKDLLGLYPGMTLYALTKTVSLQNDIMD